MTEKLEWGSFRASLESDIREVRRRYDALDRGATAPLRRSRTAEDVALLGQYWRIAGALGREQRQLSHVALLFPWAGHRRSDTFSFGRYLRRHLGPGDGAALRFRRLLDCRDWDELDRRLRAVLRLARANDAPLDWGVFGTDVLWFFAESQAVRRKWAQDFYAPTPRDMSPRLAVADVNPPSEGSP